MNKCNRCASELSFLNRPLKCSYCGSPCCEQCGGTPGSKVCCSRCKSMMIAKSGPEFDDDEELDGEMDF